MNFYKIDDNTKNILSFDIFALLGLAKAKAVEKQALSEKMGKLIFKYFLQELIGDALSAEEIENLSKTEIKSEDDVMELLRDLGSKVPNASELYVQAIMEVRARLVLEQYQNREKNLLKLLETESDETKKSLIQDKITKTQTYVNLATEGKWGDLLLEKNQK